MRDLPEAFETERLVIRCPTPGDGPELHAAVREFMGELLPWMPWPAEPTTVEDSEAIARGARVRFLERTELRMHLWLKGTETLVGSSGLHRIDWEVPKFKIGYWCRTGMTGRGYVTEAVRGIAAFAPDVLGAKRVEIRCDPLNRPSARVAQLAGFRLEGEPRNDARGMDGGLRNTLVFSATPPGPDGPPGDEPPPRPADRYLDRRGDTPGVRSLGARPALRRPRRGRRAPASAPAHTAGHE